MLPRRHTAVVRGGGDDLGTRRLDPLQVLRATAGPLSIAALYMVAVVLYEQEADAPLDLPLSIPAMLGTAISILLGFKTSAAYEG